MEKVMVLLADGFEDIEAVSIIDILRRAEIETDTVALKADNVLSARSMPVVPDKIITEIKPDDYTMVVLPGGMAGTDNLKASEDVEKILRKFSAEEKYIAAICAAPRILAAYGILNGCMATSYPLGKSEVETDCEYMEASVVVDENIITSRGPATAAEFAFTLVELLRDEETADRLREGMLFSGD